MTYLANAMISLRKSLLWLTCGVKGYARPVNAVVDIFNLKSYPFVLSLLKKVTTLNGEFTCLF